MRLEHKEADKAVLPTTRRRVRFAAAVAGTLAFLVASPEQIYINRAPMSSAFTI
jgi:hypothetical protein